MLSLFLPISIIEPKVKAQECYQNWFYFYLPSFVLIDFLGFRGSIIFKVNFIIKRFWLSTQVLPSMETFIKIIFLKVIQSTFLLCRKLTKT